MGRKNNVADINKGMGERMVMHQLITYKNWDAEYIDYVGADIIAIDHKTKAKYAISVKTRIHQYDDETCSLFTNKDAENLRKFATDMSREGDEYVPLVAYVVVKKNGTLCSFYIALSDLEDMRQEERIVKTTLKKDKNFVDRNIEQGYRFCYGDEILDEVLKDPRIGYVIRPLEKKYMENEWGEKYIKEENGLSKEYWGNQQGTFGEYLTLWQSKFHNMRSYLIQSEGVDIISCDLKNKSTQYAISVKTFSKKPTKKKNQITYVFEEKNIRHLTRFKEKWNMIPVVSLNFVILDENKQCRKIISINAKLEYIQNSIENGNLASIFTNAETKKKEYKGIKVVLNVDELNELKDDPNIDIKVMNME